MGDKTKPSVPAYRRALPGANKLAVNRSSILNDNGSEPQERCSGTMAAVSGHVHVRSPPMRTLAPGRLVVALEPRSLSIERAVHHVNENTRVDQLIGGMASRKALIDTFQDRRAGLRRPRRR